MAVLEKIRVKFGLLASIIIAIGLLLFIVDPSSVVSAVQNMSSKNDVGKINGKTISYPAFQQEIQNYTAINEMLTGASAQGAQQQEAVREAAWRNLLDKFLFIEESQKAGVELGEDEILDMLSGQNISPLILNNPMFMDKNGAFSKQALLAFLQNRNSDPSGRYNLYWDFLQNNIKTASYYDKYNSLYSAAMFNNPLIQSNFIAENNTLSDIEFVMKPYEYSTLLYNRDSSIEISKSEISKYYENHKKLYKQAESRDIEYVVFEVKPSQKDIVDNEEFVGSLKDKFAESTNVKNFLLRNSDKPYIDYWYKKGDLVFASPEVENFVWSAKEGEVSPLISGSNNTLYLAKLLETKILPDSVYVKHILLPAASNAKADSLVTVIKKGGNFEKLAEEYSLDTKSAADGKRGNIGWLTANYMIPGFQEVLTQKVNMPFVLNTNYGTHVVLVSKTTKPMPKKSVALLVKETNPSKETFSQVYSKANLFASLAKPSLKDYNKAVDSLKVYSQKSSRMLMSANKLGSIDNTKEITRWAFDNGVGSVSDIKTIDNKYFIVSVITGLHEEGYASLEEMTNQIKNILYSQKYKAKQLEKMKAETEGLTTLSSIAEKLGTTVSTKDGIAFASIANPDLDNALVGAVSTAELNKLVGPIEGQLGVYFFKVVKRDVASFYTDTDAKNEQQRIKAYTVNMILPFMMESQEVKDNRARFF